MIFTPILHVGSPKIGKFWSKQGNKTQSSLYFAIDDEKYLEQYWCLRKYHLIREFLLLQTNLTPFQEKQFSEEKTSKQSFLMLSTQSWLLNLIGVWQATLSLFKFNFSFMWTNFRSSDFANNRKFSNSIFFHMRKNFRVSNIFLFWILILRKIQILKLDFWQTIVKFSNNFNYSNSTSSSYDKQFQILKLFQIFKFKFMW